MVLETYANAIVMVTLLQEEGKRKCELYWPDRTGLPNHYGDISVTLVSAKKAKGYIMSLLTVTRGALTRNVTHFWFTGWNDHGVPRGPDGNMYADELIGRFSYQNDYLIHVFVLYSFGFLPSLHCPATP
jgi:protein tyrosine phosphatase